MRHLVRWFSMRYCNVELCWSPHNADTLLQSADPARRFAGYFSSRGSSLGCHSKSRNINWSESTV